MSKIQFTLHKGYDTRIIRFLNHYYHNLEVFLMNFCNSDSDIQYYLSTLYQLKEIWNTQEMDNLIDRRFGGYFDDEILQEIQAEGKWFSLFVTVLSAGRVQVETKIVYIDNEMSSDLQTTEIPFDDLIFILEQFRNSPIGNYNVPALIEKLKIVECEAFIHDLKQCLELHTNIKKGFFSQRIKPVSITSDYPYVVIFDREPLYVHMTHMLLFLEQHLYRHEEKRNKNLFRRFLNFIT